MVAEGLECFISLLSLILFSNSELMDVANMQMVLRKRSCNQMMPEGQDLMSLDYLNTLQNNLNAKALQTITSLYPCLGIIVA